LHRGRPTRFNEWEPSFLFLTPIFITLRFSTLKIICHFFDQLLNLDKSVLASMGLALSPVPTINLALHHRQTSALHFFYFHYSGNLPSDWLILQQTFIIYMYFITLKKVSFTFWYCSFYFIFPYFTLHLFLYFILPDLDMFFTHIYLFRLSFHRYIRSPCH